MGQQYGQLLLPAFPQITAAIERLWQDPLQISSMEKIPDFKITLLEAVTSIANNFKNFLTQTDIIGKILLPEVEALNSLREAYVSPDSFVRDLGLDCETENEIHIQRRARLSYISGLVRALVRRSAAPSDPAEAVAGG